VTAIQSLELMTECSRLHSVISSKLWIAVTVPRNLQVWMALTGFVNVKLWYLIPHRIDTPQPIVNKFFAGDYFGDPYCCAKFHANLFTGASWQMGEIGNRFFIYTFFGEQG